MTIKVGISLTAFSHESVPLAVEAEKAGFESVFVPDHAVFPSNPVTPYPARDDGEIPQPYRDMADPFVLLGAIATLTSEIKLATGVAILPERHPLIMANSVATLDRIANGRVILGIGSGWLPEELALYGVRFDRKWSQAEEHALAMRALWTHGHASFHGKYVNFTSVGCFPMPVQQPIPMIIGSAPSERTFDRVARIGDGWYPTVLTPEQAKAGREAIARRCEVHGRNPEEIETSVFTMDTSPEMQEQYEAAGVKRIVVGLHGHPGTRLPPEEARLAWYGGLALPRKGLEESKEMLWKLADMSGLKARG